MIAKLSLTALLATLAVGAQAQAQANEMTSAHLATLDTNGDGMVSKEEYDQFSKFAFDQMDTNKDGKISKSEYGAMMPDDGFEDIDTNANDTVSETEFMNQMLSDFTGADKNGNGMLD